jgi:hypothetical protein
MGFRNGGNPKSNQKRNNNNYFTSNIQKAGENFMDTKNARDLQFDAIKIFRDLARGNVDIAKYGQYLLDPMMLNACLSAANTKLMYYSISFSGVNCLVNSLSTSGNQIDPNIIMVLEDHRKSMEVYQAILTHFTALRDTGDIGYLVSLVNAISRYRSNI